MAKQAQIFDIPILSLRPTQATVGYREVRRKRSDWRAHVATKGPRFTATHVIPVVVGPAARPYAIDRHHLARALHDEGVKRVAISVVADASSLPCHKFWDYLATRSWGHLADEDGRPVDPWTMPTTIAEVADDPYRSLAGALRRSGGYVKSPAPCSEFLWADFLRARIDPDLVRHDFDAALACALVLAKAPPTAALPYSDMRETV